MIVNGVVDPVLASTLPENQWPVSYNLPPSGSPTVHVTTAGSLCAEAGELTTQRYFVRVVSGGVKG